MGFLDAIIRFFMGSDYDNKVRNLDSRIFELRKYKRDADVIFEKLKRTVINIPSFDIHHSEVHPKNEIQTFTPVKREKIPSMKDLMDKRKEEEVQRKKRLIQQIK